MPSSTVEDYLKTILVQEQGLSGGEYVHMGKIASVLEVAPGTVTSMVKTLERNALLTYEPYVGVRLTDDGRRQAVHVLRRHRLIELFLVEILNLDWSEVHEEAERLEHVMSDRLIERIDVLLGFPRTDPHGDPIPDLNGKIRESASINLVDCSPGSLVRIVRVSSDKDEDFLRFAERHGLKPGVRVAVERHDSVASAMTLRADGFPEVTLGNEAAAKLWVEPMPVPLGSV